MFAIDTNVLVRYLVADDPQQSARARAVIEAEEVFVATTVLLEAEWVLRSVYAYAATELARAFRAFAGLPGVVIDDPAPVARALAWLEAGMDFADALHLAKAADCEAFLSFDKRLARLSKHLGAPVV